MKIYKSLEAQITLQYFELKFIFGNFFFYQMFLDPSKKQKSSGIESHNSG